jgi:glycosyltransferase involved in cell wall biosynthesis
VNPGKIGVIYNGFDEADFADLPIPPKEPQFEILHAGLVTREFRDPAPVLEAIAHLIAKGVMARERTRVVFLGSRGYFIAGPGRELVDGLGLSDVVELSARIPNRETLSRLRHASCLLLLQASDDTRSLVPAKTFEYLRVERPILALTPQGVTSDLLKKMDHCSVVDPSDRRGLQDALTKLYREWSESSKPIISTRQISNFERSVLTAELAQTLQDLLEESQNA